MEWRAKNMTSKNCHACIKKFVTAWIGMRRKREKKTRFQSTVIILLFLKRHSLRESYAKQTFQGRSLCDHHDDNPPIQCLMFTLFNSFDICGISTTLQTSRKREKNEQKSFLITCQSLHCINATKNQPKKKLAVTIGN